MIIDSGLFDTLGYLKDKNHKQKYFKNNVHIYLFFKQTYANLLKNSLPF